MISRLPGAASRAWHELDFFEAQMATVLWDERGDHGLLVALCAGEHRRLLAAVIVAPLPQADDLSIITQPTLIANGDNDRMVPSILSEDMHQRIKGSELIIYPDSGHGGIFQLHDKFAPIAVEFLTN